MKNNWRDFLAFPLWIVTMIGVAVALAGAWSVTKISPASTLLGMPEFRLVKSKRSTYKE